jgi:hypothetical protein
VFAEYSWIVWWFMTFWWRFVILYDKFRRHPYIWSEQPRDEGLHERQMQLPIRREYSSFVHYKKSNQWSDDMCQEQLLLPVTRHTAWPMFCKCHSINILFI